MEENYHEAKHDHGKPLAGCLLEFSEALKEVSKISTFGAEKYGRGTWPDVPDAKERYIDAALRHLLDAEDNLDKLDSDSGLLNLSHLAWNVLALLELKKRKEKAMKEEKAVESFVEKIRVRIKAWK